jgi:hypothetical protein
MAGTHGGARRRRQGLDRAAADEDAAAGRAVETAQQVQEGGLPRARGPDHGQEVAAAHLEVDAGEGGHGARPRAVDAAHAIERGDPHASSSRPVRR